MVVGQGWRNLYMLLQQKIENCHGEDLKRKYAGDELKKRMRHRRRDLAGAFFRWERWKGVGRLIRESNPCLGWRVWV